MRDGWEFADQKRDDSSRDSPLWKIRKTAD
jgi:hypothetical protein